MSDISQLENEFNAYINQLPGPSNVLQTNLFCQSYIHQKIRAMFPQEEKESPQLVFQRHINEKEMLEMHKNIEKIYELTIRNLENQYLLLQNRQKENNDNLDTVEQNNKKLQKKLEDFIKECYDLEVENQNLRDQLQKKNIQLQESEQNLQETKNKMKDKYSQAHTQLQQMEDNYRQKVELLMSDKESFQKSIETYAQEIIQQELDGMKKKYEMESKLHQEQIEKLKQIVQEKDERNFAMMDLVRQFKEKYKQNDLEQMQQKFEQQEQLHKQQIEQLKQSYTSVKTNNQKSFEKKNALRSAKKVSQPDEPIPKRRNCRLCEQIKNQKNGETHHHNHD